tara:strand:+ start:246 stop:593 length:348 start_codon:yes stop_codon:yes gene_type:complete
MATYKVITTSATHDLISKVASKSMRNVGNLKKITIANTDTVDAVDVDLFIEDETAAATTNAGNVKHYIIFNVDIPAGVTLVLDDNLQYDASLYHLRIKTNNGGDGGASQLSVIIH